MKRLLAYLFLFSLIICLIPNQAKAITYDLDYIIAGGATLIPTPSYGTVTLTDSGNSVNIAINLTGNTLKIHRFYLNYDDGLFSNSSSFGITTGVVTVDENNSKPDGYAYRFDLLIDGGKGSTLNLIDQYDGAISLPTFDLNPSHFNFTDTGNNLYVAMHIGNVPGLPEGDSIWVGGTPQTTTVPEPAAMFLLGSGLIGLAALARRAIQRQ